MKKIIAMILALTMVFAMAACGASGNDTGDMGPDMVYAVEAGSAGEAVALEKGWEIVSVDTQSKALMEVASGTSDAAIIDLLMAGAMIGEGTAYPDLTYTVSLTSEEYVVGFRKGSELVDEFNNFWADACAEGTVLEVAKTYGVQESVIIK